MTKKGTERTAEKSCIVSQAEKSSNPTLNFFFNTVDFATLKNQGFERKRFKKEYGSWNVNADGFLQIVYQTEVHGYHARSFEDAFFSIPRNIQFIKANRSKFEGLKNVSYFYKATKTPFDLAQECIESKGTFAIDVLMYSAQSNFADWDIPAYLKEGLLWLKQD